MITILDRVTIAVMKQEKGLISFTCLYNGSSRAVRAGTWQQELMQRPWMSAACWLVQPSFL